MRRSDGTSGEGGPGPAPFRAGRRVTVRPVLFGPPVIPPDATAARRQLYRAEGLCSLLAVPLRIRGRICGTLIVYHWRPHHFDDLEVEVATAVANLSAATIGPAELSEQQSRLRTEAQAREDRLWRALETGRMGVCDWDVRTNAIRWSETLEPSHGRAPGTFGGTLEAFPQLIRPADRASVTRALEESLGSRSEYSLEFRIVRRDGAVR